MFLYRRVYRWWTNRRKVSSFHYKTLFGKVKPIMYWAKIVDIKCKFTIIRKFKGETWVWIESNDGRFKNYGPLEMHLFE